LGLIGYYRRFFKDYGKITQPLTQLLKKDNFKWKEKALTTMEKLKILVAYLPILTVPDFSETFIIKTDVCNQGIGAVLKQEGWPMAFLIQTHSTRAQSKSVHERELMAIVLAI